MEQGRVLRAGAHELSAEEVVRRLAAAPPGRRMSPRRPAAAAPDGDDAGDAGDPGDSAGAAGAAGAADAGDVADAGGTDAAGGRPRGDHDLNPDFYRPGAALVAAAVLVPLVVRESGLSLLFTRRTEHLADHPGQISFPGGRVATADADAWAAALRETEEEVGLPRTRVHRAGRLDTYVTRTGFEVTPLVGLVRPPFPLAPDRFEVAEVFEAPLGFFLDPAHREIHSRVYQGKERFFFAFPFGDYYIWGATAGMLVNLVEVLTGE